jgi:hypothetical protein
MIVCFPRPSSGWPAPNILARALGMLQASTGDVTPGRVREGGKNTDCLGDVYHFPQPVQVLAL